MAPSGTFLLPLDSGSISVSIDCVSVSVNCDGLLVLVSSVSVGISVFVNCDGFAENRFVGALLVLSEGVWVVGCRIHNLHVMCK